jgi:hypothetical protein
MARLTTEMFTMLELLTVPLIETTIVPVTLPNNRPADIVNGTAGIASTGTKQTVKQDH